MHFKFIIGLCLFAVCACVMPLSAQDERSHRVTRGQNLN